MIVEYVFVAAAVVWQIRRAIRGLRRAKSSFDARVKVANVHLMDPDKQFQVFRTDRNLLSPSTAFEEAYAATAEANNADAADAAVARALAERKRLAADPPKPVGEPQSFGRRRS